MYICIDKTETIHRFYCYFVEISTVLAGNGILFAIPLGVTCLSVLNVSHGSRDCKRIPKYTKHKLAEQY